MELYVSKRCPHSRKLLMLLQNNKSNLNYIKIICIDEQPFPKYIKKVPTMVVGNELWDNQKILSMITTNNTNTNTNTNNKQCKVNNNDNNDDDELLGYCDNGQCYYGIDEQPVDTYFEEINDDISESKPIIRSDDNNNNKSGGMDRDYEKMMEERQLIK